MGQAGMGADFKKSITQLGGWKMSLYGFGEILPYHHNKVQLNPNKKDIHGLPTLYIETKLGENELAMKKDILAAGKEMLEAAGGKNIAVWDGDAPMGNGVHEMGTARMGHDPKTSVLNKWNQCHEAKNVFVTDGACMTSASCVNPSLTYMALTVRAVDYAVKELNKQNL